MDFMQTISRPWREPIEYLELAFWIAIFLIVVFMLTDTLRIVASFGARAVSEI